MLPRNLLALRTIQPFSFLSVIPKLFDLILSENYSKTFRPSCLYLEKKLKLILFEFRNTRIVGGQSAVIGQYNWLANLGYVQVNHITMMITSMRSEA